MNAEKSRLAEKYGYSGAVLILEVRRISNLMNLTHNKIRKDEYKKQIENLNRNIKRCR